MDASLQIQMFSFLVLGQCIEISVLVSQMTFSMLLTSFIVNIRHIYILHFVH